MSEENTDTLQGKVDVSSSVPYYLQLKKEINRALKRGHLKPGDQMPSESELCAMFNVSRTVVRRALDELEYESLIERIRGKGTFVTKPKISEGLAQKLTGFYQDMVDKGLKPFTRTLRCEVIPANARLAHLLDLETGTPILEVERLRYVDDEPFLLGITDIEYDICPALLEADLSNQSLYAFLERECGVVITNARRTIEAVAAMEREARLLNVKEGAALLMLRSIGCQKNGRPVEYFRGLHRGDRSCFEIDLVRE